MEIRASETLKKSYRKAQYLAFAIASSMLMIAVAVEALIHGGNGFGGYADSASGFDPTIAFWGVAIAMLLASMRVPRVMLQPKDTPRGNAMNLLMPQTRHTRMLQAVLVSLALCDGVAILGFGQFLLTGERGHFYALWALGMVFLIVNFPSFRQWQAWGNQIGRMR